MSRQPSAFKPRMPSPVDSLGTSMRHPRFFLYAVYVFSVLMLFFLPFFLAPFFFEGVANCTTLHYSDCVLELGTTFACSRKA